MNSRAWVRGKWLAWQVAGPDWDIRMKAHWRWWVRRWGFAVAACCLTWAWVMWLFAPTWQTHGQLQSEVRALQTQLAGVPAVHPQVAGPVMLDDVHRLPTLGQQDEVWSQLQNTLADHGVRLMGMQPVTDLGLAPLPSRAMSLRLQARFEHWVQVWASLISMGPVWSMDRLQVVPSAVKSGVDIEVVWRVWFNPDTSGASLHGAQFAGGSSERLHAALPKNSASVFDMPFQIAPELGRDAPGRVLPASGVALGVLPETADLADSLPKTLVFSNEPERWPMLPLRVIGIWRHGEQAEAVVANATHWFRTQEGRLVSLEGHRVWRIGRDDIEVRDPVGRVQTIAMETRTP